MGYTHDALKTYVPQMVEQLVDTVRNHVFMDWEVKEQVTHISLAFEVPGGWHKEKVAMAATVLQLLMGGGGSFSAGGPGKGMHSRMYLRVLNEYHQIQSFSAFSNIYTDTGLFGIHASTGVWFASKVVDLAVRELLEVETAGKVTHAELDRVKTATKSVVLMNLESRMVVSEDIGCLLYSDKWFA